MLPKDAGSILERGKKAEKAGRGRKMTGKNEAKNQARTKQERNKKKQERSKNRAKTMLERVSIEHSPGRRTP
ncbi:hypothetical protein [Paenibacillus sp. HGH0039]|nr:hypothetical protein [Paenibacillus sp. HGH0039]EGL18737.1 hypothetical protein HMPREF9413_2546 [Paenibacillus sp. HGF7]